MVNANLKDSSDLAVLLDQRGMDWLDSQDFGDVWFFQSLRGRGSRDIYVRAHVKPNLHMVVRWDGEEWVPEGELTLEEFADSVETVTDPVSWVDAAREIGEVPVKDDPEMAQFEGGGQRSSDEGRPRFDMLFVTHLGYEEQVLTRAALRMEEGARKYGARNFEQFQDEEALERARASLLRHTIQLVNGETDEDHAAAVIANVVMLSSVEKKVNDANN